MNKKLLQLIWKFLDVLLYIVGFGAIVGALFLWSQIAGWIGVGVSAIVTGLVIDNLPLKGGGD